MTILLILVGIVLIVVGIIVELLEESVTAVVASSIVVIGSALIIGAISSSYNESHSNVPTALDVYRGNTTLEITYRDSVAVDTVVVFKK